MPSIRHIAALWGLPLLLSAPALADARLSSVEYADGVVTVALSEPSAWKSSFWKSAKRFILDIPARSIEPELRSLPVGSDRLSTVRWNQTDENTVRVVLDLNQAEEPQVLSHPGEAAIRVFVGPGAPLSDPEAPGPRTSFRITDIRVERNADDQISRIVVLTEKPALPSAEWSLNSLFLDFEGGENGLGERVFVVGDGGLLRVRPVRIRNGARVALDFTRRVSYKVSPLSGECGIAVEYLEPDDSTEDYGAIEMEPETERPRVPRKLSEMLIVLDPGHGAHNSGARSAYATEKTANLDIALRLKALLESKGARVVLTRDQDVFIPLRDRPALAMRLKADAFVSIHCNSSQRPVNTGIEVYYRRNDREAHRLGAALYKAQRTATRQNGRGIRPDSRAPQGGLAVLKNNTVPCALVEVGFINSPVEGRCIADPAWRQKVAEALARGLRDFGGAGE